jgi:tetratricopeptide (TPR) repeat protein
MKECLASGPSAEFTVAQTCQWRTHPMKTNSIACLDKPLAGWAWRHAHLWRSLCRPLWRWVLLIASGAAFIALPSHAAMGDSSPGDASWLSAARADIKAQRYDQAVASLRTANATDNADWHNLLGYALRKKTPPDLAAAETHYTRALELDPKHRLALEYYGELFLMKGDLAGAEGMLARLDKACVFSCEEFRDLKAAVARFKAQAGKGK